MAQPRGFQATRCPICRQFELGEMQWIDLSVIFGFDLDMMCEIDQLPPEAQEYARSFQRGEITQEQLEARADENLPAMEEDENQWRLQLMKVKERVDRNKNNKTYDFMKVNSLMNSLSLSLHLKLVSKTSMILKGKNKKSKMIQDAVRHTFLT